MSFRVFCGLSLSLLLLPACGGGGAGASGPLDPYSQPKVPPVMTPMPSLAFSVPPGGAVKLDFDGPQAAYLFATLDWSDPGNNLVAVFTGRGCYSINDALAGLCSDSDVYGSRSTCVAKPRTLTASYYRPVALRLWIANLGSAEDAGRVDLIQCTDAPNCGASMSCAQCTSEALRRRSCK